MGKFRDEDVDYNIKQTLRTTMIPWIDVHGHHHTMTWRDYDELELTGCHAIIMTGGLGNEFPYRPARPEDIRSGWDRTIRIGSAISRSHLFETFSTVGIHTSVGPIKNIEQLYDSLPEYAELDSVVAISETGISMIQEHKIVPIEEQKKIIRQQLCVAQNKDLPAILHTPTISKSDDQYVMNSLEAHDSKGPVLNTDRKKIDAVQINLEIANEVGFPEDRLVFTHSNGPMASWVLENTKSNVSFTVGNGTRNVNLDNIASTIREYDSSRIMIDSDSASHKRIEPCAVKRTIIELMKIGINPSDLRKVVYDNQRKILNLEDKIAPSVA